MTSILFLLTQILLVSTLGNVWRTAIGICILMFGCKGLRANSRNVSWQRAMRLIRWMVSRSTLVCLITREKYNFCNRTLLCNPLQMCLVINLFAFCFSVFQAASLSINNEFKSGRLLAYKLMCAMTVSRQDMPLSQEYLTHFYRLMHIGLTGTDQVRFHKK